MVRRIGLLVIGLLLVTDVTSAQVTRTQRLSASERLVIGSNVFGTTSPLQVVGLPAKTSQTACAWLDGSGNVFTGACPTGDITGVSFTLPSALFTTPPTGSPCTSGDCAFTFALANQSANVVFAGPTSGGAAAPTFRSVVRADIPSALAYEDEANAFTANQTIGDSSYLSRATYASQTTGWRIDAAGGADFRYLFTDELHAKSFIADLEQALAGGQIIAKSVAMVSQTFTCPAGASSAALWVRDLPSAPNMAAFQANDWVVLRSFSRAAGSLTISECVGQVSSYTDGTAGDDGQQLWNFARGGSGCEGGMTVGATVAPEAIVIDYGSSGNGYHEVNAIDGAYAANAPYSQTVTWATCPVAANRTVRTRVGRLDGLFGGSNEFGIVAGVATGAFADKTDDKYIRASTAAVELINVDLSLYDGSTETVKIAGATSAPYLGIGNPAPTAFGGTGFWVGDDGGTYKLSIGAAGKALAWDGTTLTLGDSSNEHLAATGSLLEFRNGATVLGSLSGSTLTLGQPLTANNTGQIVIDSDSIDMNWRNNSGSTSTPFRISNSSGSALAFLNGWNFSPTTIGVGADGNTVVTVCSGVGCEGRLSAAGSLTIGSASMEPVTDNYPSLGSSAKKWASLYVTEDATGDSLHPAVWASGKLKAKTDGYSGACAGTVTVENGIVTGCS